MYEKRRNFDAVFLNGTVESPERYRCAAGSRVAFGLIAIGREHKSGRTGGRLSVLSARTRRVETPRTRSYYVRGIIRARTPSFPPHTPLRSSTDDFPGVRKYAFPEGCAALLLPGPDDDDRYHRPGRTVHTMRPRLRCFLSNNDRRVPVKNTPARSASATFTMTERVCIYRTRRVVTPVSD